MRSLLLPVALCAFGLAACDRQDGQGTTVSIDAGNGAASINGATGEVKLDTPLLKGSIKLPRMQFTGDNFEINGVHLYPGTKIGAMNVNAGGNEGDGVVRMSFESPAAVDTVRDWLAGEFAKAGTTVKVSGNTLSGDTDGKPFRIDLQPAGDRAAGTVTIGG